MKRNNQHKKRSVFAGAMLLICAFVLLSHNAFSAETAIMRVNRVYCGIIDNGSVGAFSYGSTFFPADYNCMGPSMEEGSGLTGSSVKTAATNWVDPNGKTIAAAVVRPVDNYSKWSLSSPLENYLRYGYPTNIVNFNSIALENWGVVDASKMIGTSDQTAYAASINDMGVEIERKIFAWSQTFHDNYIVVDMTLTNKSDQTLNDFWFEFAQSPFYWRVAKGSNPSIPGGDGVNRNASWHHYYGGRPGDSLRVWYMVPADDPQTVGDQMGGMVKSQDGRISLSDMAWYTILHASEAPFTDPANDKNDPLQPRSTTVWAENPIGVQALWGGNDVSGRELVHSLMTGKHGKEQPMEGQYPGTFHRANNDEMGDPDYTVLGEGFSTSAIWNSSYSSFGPYTFEPGQKLHVVFAGGYTGLGIELEKELGEQWLAGTLQDPPGLPDARTGYFPSNFAFPVDARPIDLIKDRWISTVIDSVHKSASKAKWNFSKNWQVPGAPPPPAQEVTGYGDGVEVKWSDPDAEALASFDGYRIMRKAGRVDTVFYEQVYRTDASDKASEHTWKDNEVLFGGSYFYYVQAGSKIAANDQNAYPANRGKTVWSGRLFIPTSTPVQPPRLAQSNLDSIRIVPNPYNYRDPLVVDYGWDGDRGIIFFNLPPVITIKIFTESGDLVRTIQHEPLTRAGSTTWDMLTDNQQVISSGVYIAVFEVPEGGVAYQKFLVIR